MGAGYLPGTCAVLVAAQFVPVRPYNVDGVAQVGDAASQCEIYRNKSICYAAIERGNFTAYRFGANRDGINEIAESGGGGNGRRPQHRRRNSKAVLSRRCQGRPCRSRQTTRRAG